MFAVVAVDMLHKDFRLGPQAFAKQKKIIESGTNWEHLEVLTMWVIIAVFLPTLFMLSVYVDSSDATYVLCVFASGWNL